jgi:hypothetical protein
VSEKKLLRSVANFRQLEPVRSPPRRIIRHADLNAAGRPAPDNAGGMNNVTVDQSGIGSASRIAPLPPPRISLPAVP